MNNDIIKAAILSLLFFLVVVVFANCDKDDLWDTLIPETDEELTASQVNGYVFRPALVPATDERVSQLRVPSGFRVQKFAEDLGMPRILLQGPGNVVYASDREAGDIAGMNMLEYIKMLKSSPVKFPG